MNKTWMSLWSRNRKNTRLVWHTRLQITRQTINWNSTKIKKTSSHSDNSRMTQSSVHMLKSWRANCDIQLLIYNSDPANPNLWEISRVVDYVVGYTCKGDTTLKEERETNKHLAQHAQEVTGNNFDLRSLSTKIMNKAASNCLISKQEASVLLGDLPLTMLQVRS